MAQDDPYFGRMNDPVASASLTGPCGDTMEFYLVVRNDLIEEVKYYTMGCGNTVNCGRQQPPGAGAENNRRTFDQRRGDYPFRRMRTGGRAALRVWPSARCTARSRITCWRRRKHILRRGGSMSTFQQIIYKPIGTIFSGHLVEDRHPSARFFARDCPGARGNFRNTPKCVIWTGFRMFICFIISIRLTRSG